MSGPPLRAVLQLMVEAPGRCRSLDAVLHTFIDERGALEVDRRRWADELHQRPEELLERPMRSNWGGEWRYRVQMLDREVTLFPPMTTSKADPAMLRPAWPAAGWPGAVDLMLSPHRLLAACQFDLSVESGEVGGRRCYVLRGRPRPAPLPTGLGDWLRSSDGVSAAVDAALGIARAVTVEAAGFPWCRFELHDADASMAAGDEQGGAEPAERIGLSVADAVAQTRFPLYVPRRMPEGSEMWISAASTGEWALVSLALPDSRWPVLLEQQSADSPVGELLEAWEGLDGHGRPTWIWDRTADHGRAGHRWVVTRTTRTYISIYSRLPRALLLAVVASLEQAS